MYAHVNPCTSLFSGYLIHPGIGSVLTGVKRFLAFLALTIVGALCFACGGGEKADSAGGAAATTSVVNIEGFAFKPESVDVVAGSTVSWANKDSAPHRIQPADALFPTSPNIEGDSTFEHTYEATGTFPYVCGIHNYMTGTVVVS